MNKTELVKQLHLLSVQTVHLAWGIDMFVPRTKPPSLQLTSTLHSHIVAFKEVNWREKAKVFQALCTPVWGFSTYWLSHLDANWL